MSSNIKVQRICQYCGNDFTARTTTTLYCSHRCNSAAYKAKQRNVKVETSNKETLRIKTQPIEELKAKVYLTVRETAALLNCSVRTIYFYIGNGKIKAVNLSQRLTRIKRSEIDKLFEQAENEATQDEIKLNQVKYEIAECLNLSEVSNKYGISGKALYEIIKRNNVPKIIKGKYTFVPKVIIDRLFNNN
jgi:excisionase family DNA binding protein